MDQAQQSGYKKMFAIELFAPAFGILRPLQRTELMVRVLYIAIPVLAVAAWYRIVAVTALFTPDGFGFFLLLVVLPFLMGLYYFLWVKKLFELAKPWSGILRKFPSFLFRLNLVFLPVFVLAFWFFIVFGGNFALYDNIVVNITGLMLFSTLISLAFFLSHIYSCKDLRIGRMVASLLPVLGIQGTPFFLRGDYMKGLIYLMGGGLLVGSVVYGQINAIREFRFIVNIISYFSVWLYALAWYYSLSHLANHKESSIGFESLGDEKAQT